MNVERERLLSSSNPSLHQKRDSIVLSLHNGQASLFSSTFNLAHAAIGSGILAFPFAFKCSGLLLGSILCIILALFMSFSLYLITRSVIHLNAVDDAFQESHHRALAHSIKENITSGHTPEEIFRKLASGTFSYEVLMERVFGKRAGVFATICIIFTCFGATVGFLIIIGDILPKLFSLWLGSEHFLADRTLVTILTAAVFLVPLSSLPNINHLRFSSVIGLIAISYMTAVVIYRSSGQLSSEHIVLAVWDWSIFRSLPIITFGLACHLQAVPIYQEMKNHSMKRMKIVVVTTQSLCVILYCVFGTFGYLTFYGNVDGNVLNNYSIHDMIVDAGRIAVAVTVIGSYPLYNYPLKTAIDYFLFYNKKNAMTQIRLVIITVISVSLAVFVALAVPDISLVFGLTGSTAATVTTFILPSLLQLKKGFKRSDTLISLLSYALLMLGIIIGVISTGILTMDLVKRLHTVSM